MTTPLYPSITRDEYFFRNHEHALAGIAANYPHSSLLQTTSAPSTMRQNLKRAIQIYINQESIISPIDRETCKQILYNFVFSTNPDGQVYVGPARPTYKPKIASITSPDKPCSITLPPIDCYSREIAQAVFTLKNYECIPIPLTLTNLATCNLPDPNQFPNIELLPGETPDSYTIL